MDEQELIKERFKSAVSSAVKAISEKYDIEIKFGNYLRLLLGQKFWFYIFGPSGISKACTYN